MKFRNLLEKIQDFRLMPFYVIASIVAGVLLGNHLRISNYELTPPIVAIEKILSGHFEFTLPNVISLGVPVGLFVMIYPAMTNLSLTDLSKASKSPKQLAIVGFLNYAVAPFFMYGLAWLFLRNHDPQFFTGVVLYGFAPCIAMVIVFTFLAGGNNALALVLVAVNSVAQMVLIPVYARLLLGTVQFDVIIVGESVVLYLGLPLVLGFLTRKVGTDKHGERGFEEKYGPILGSLSIAGLLFTLIVMFSLKGDLIVNEPSIIAIIALPMTIFFFVMFNVAYLVGWKSGLSYRDSVAVAFNSTGRDFEIAIAIAITAFTPTVALATVVGPLIEVPVMLTLVWIARKSSTKLFGGMGE